MAIAVTTEADFDCSESIVQALDGVVYVATQDDEWILTPGDSAHIALGTPYRYWDAGDDEAQWIEVHCAA
jgi:quercetin dioxygenase-like cupin family protein